MKTSDSLFLEREIELSGSLYDCAFDVEVTLERWEEYHGPGLREPCNETFVDVTDLSATLEGAEVEDKAILRQLKIEAQEWAENNVQQLIEKANL